MMKGLQRKERVVSSASQPALNIARTVCRPTWAAPDFGSVDGSSGPGERTGSGGILGCEGIVEGNRVPCEAVAERDEALDSEEVYERFRYGWPVCLVALVDAVGKNTR